RECHKVGPDGNVLLHRAFSVFLFNKRGDMFLQRRASQKVTYPDYYTNACCSHPLYIDDKPEEIITAARRRLNHELGIPLNDSDVKVKPNSNEISEYCFVPKAEFNS
ncbi:Isopentenyl-diphosphate delta isomerase, partial [Operophtera brumata]